MDCELSINVQPSANNIIEWGLFTSAASTPFAPTDGVFFRLTSTGLYGVVNFNGTETLVGPFPAAAGAGTWTYTNTKKYQFILYITTRDAEFWVADGITCSQLGNIKCPLTQGAPFQGTAVPVHFNHRIIGGAAGTAMNASFYRYSVRLGGPNLVADPGSWASRALGSYVALSGASPGSLQGSTISSGSTTAPTAAAPTNTTNALGQAGLGTYVWETFSLALGTDGIIASYQVPTQSMGAQTRRLRINGISLASTVQTVLAGGPQNRFFYLAFGGTTVSLAATESGFVKLARRLRLPFVQTITSNQAVNTAIAQNIFDYKFVNPVYVNPGEWVQVVVHAIGTVGTSGTIADIIAMDYTWE